MINYLENQMGVKTLTSTPRPNLVCYLALHQCYSDSPVHRQLETLSELPDSELGRRLVDKCIKFGHWSVAEQAFFSFNAWGYPHDVLVQARTHRHLSFSAQSQRYTYKKIFDLGNQYILNGIVDYNALQQLFYFRRPDQKYLDRDGNKYLYSQSDFENDIIDTFESAVKFSERVTNGKAPEHARQLLNQNIRQHFVVGGNARAILHFCDLRLPKDAQCEIQHMAKSLFDNFSEYMPELAAWYKQNRYGKSKLSP
jgi:thymidylate synthase (FAD)